MEIVELSSDNICTCFNGNCDDRGKWEKGRWIVDLRCTICFKKPTLNAAIQFLAESVHQLDHCKLGSSQG